MLIFCLIFLGGNSRAANSPLKPLRVEKPPVIDGVLDDAAWSESASVSGFLTYMPDFGRTMEGDTRVYMAYDRENLFFAFRCYDSRPDKIKASVTSRDNFRPEDWVCINLDTFNDRQSLYAFYINPNGIQGDSRFTAGKEDMDFDNVWYSSGKIDDQGYTVEVQVPLKSIRFSGREEVTMGVIFERYISRASQAGTWPALDPDQGVSFLTQTMPIVFYDLDQEKVFEVLPAVTYSFRERDEGSAWSTGQNQADFSLTAKLGLTSDLILDGAYNPDFSQVEADAGQVDVNLRYALYYPEKRPFFLEGRDHFRIAATTVSETDPVKYVINTRTILNPVAGVKLTGKTGRKGIVSAMYAMDELPEDLPGDRAHFTLVRYKHALREDSFIGGIYTTRSSDYETNHVAGLDGQFRVTQAATLDCHMLFTGTSRVGMSDPDNTAPGKSHKRFSRSPVLLEQPDARGLGLGVAFRHSDRDVDVFLTGKEISEDFQVDMGYVTRTGISQATALVRPKFYPGPVWIQRMDVELFSAQTRDKPSGMWETFNHISVQQFFLGRFSWKGKYGYSTEIFLGKRFRTGGWHGMVEGWVTKAFYLGILYRHINAIYYSEDPFQGISNRVTGSLIYQPSQKLNFEASLVYSDFTRDSDGERLYDYPIYRGKLTYQLNRYLFFRGILEYNRYYDELLTDLLASFTYIPGTVFHLGYGVLYHQQKWEDDRWIPVSRFHEAKRGFFLKASYLWRL
jgi:hypothetical protein